MATNPQPHWHELMALPGAITVEQFEQMPSTDGYVYELHAGRLIIMPGPGKEHGVIQEQMIFVIGGYLRTHQLGRLRATSCYNLPLPNAPEEVRCPDLSYVTPANDTAMPMRGSYPVGAPDLAIEIASPSDTHPMLADKCRIYVAAGVRLIWVVWPHAQTVDVWRPVSPDKPVQTLTGTDQIDGAEIIPGFQCPLPEIFS